MLLCARFNSLGRMHRVLQRGLCHTAVQPGRAEGMYGLTYLANGKCVASSSLARQCSRARSVMPHLPAEQASGSPPLGQLMGRLAGRVAVALWRLVQAHQIVQKVHLSSIGVTTASSKN